MKNQTIRKENKYEKKINEDISDLKNADLISDGYHTFKELYDHRIRLFIELCRAMSYHFHYRIFRNKVDKDWMILGLYDDTKKGTQITYHLPIKYWKECEQFSKTDNPKFDGHTSKDVLKRLEKIGMFHI